MALSRRLRYNGKKKGCAMTFEKLGLIPELLSALTPLGYVKPTAVQSKVIPVVMEGKDVIATAQTGTGKRLLMLYPSCNI